MKDETLLKLWHINQNEALGTIMTEYGKLLWIVVEDVLGNIATNELIEDTVSDTFCYTWKNFNTYDINKKSFKNWLVMIAEDRAANAVKKNSRENDLIARIQEKYLHNEASLIREEYDALENIIDRLPEPYREISIRRHLYGLTPKEISKTMNMPIKKVNYYLYEAKKKIKYRRELYEI